MGTTVTGLQSAVAGRVRTVVLTLGIALLGIALVTPSARAATSNEVHDNGEFQAMLCEAGGGSAEVHVTRTSKGIESVTVVCHGGVYDGMACLNDTSYGTMCQDVFPHSTPQDTGSHIWPIDTVIPILEAGSRQQWNAILTDLEAANASVPDLTSPAPESGPTAAPAVGSSDDRDHDTGKGKKGKKKGKKGGRGRR